MEKKTRHYRLAEIRAMVEAGRVRSTLTALAGGAALSFHIDGVVRVVLALTKKISIRACNPR